MLKIESHRRFEKHLKQRVKPGSRLGKKFVERVRLFQVDRTNLILKDHALTGKLSGMRGFWITGDVRVVYKMIGAETVRFYDVGSHAQVYGM